MRCGGTTGPQSSSSPAIFTVFPPPPRILNFDFLTYDCAKVPVRCEMESQATSHQHFFPLLLLHRTQLSTVVMFLVVLRYSSSSFLQRRLPPFFSIIHRSARSFPPRRGGRRQVRPPACCAVLVAARTTPFFSCCLPGPGPRPTVPLSSYHRRGGFSSPPRGAEFFVA